MAHVNAAMLEIKNLNEFITKFALKQGLRNGHLNYSLDKNFIKSYTKLLEYARKYA